MRSLRAMGIRRDGKPARRASGKRRSLGSLGLLVVLAIVGVNLVIVGLIGSFLVEYDASERRQAGTNAENLSRALEAGLEGKFSQIDLIVQTIGDEYRRELGAKGVDPAQLQAMLDRQAARLPDTAGIRVADDSGFMRYASHMKVVNPISVGDRDYFRAVRDNPNAGLVVTKPEFGRILKSWIVIFARRIEDPDGAFAGEVHIAMPTEELYRMFSRLDVGQHGLVGLWTDAVTEIARFPSLMQADGGMSMIPKPSADLRALIASGRASGAYHAVAGTDGVPRLFYTRKVGRFPLYVVVGLADVDYTADLRSVVLHLGMVYFLFLFACGFGGLAIHSRAATKAKAEAQSRLAASVYDNSSEGMMVLDAQRRLVDVNPSFTKLTGFTANETRGWRVGRLFSSLREVGQVSGVARALLESGHWSGEMWLARNHGGSFLARLSVSAIDGAGTGGAKYVAMFSDATEQKRAQETIWRHANFDVVTQLPNRRLFCDRLRSEIDRSAGAETPIAVIFIDLDRFKEVNDRFGHEIGDLLLVQAAERIRSSVRSDDVVARLGGDEFTVMLPDVGEGKVLERIARDIVAALARPYPLAGGQCFNSASLGVTLYPRDGRDVETLLRNADQAMYSAKNNGRNRFAFFAPSLHLITSNRARLASDLHSALANNELELHYQPIVEIGSGRLVKAEALARWRHPRLGMVAPGEFIPIAEETGLIIEIGDWAFRRAAQQAQAWRRAHDPAFKISVNVSAVQLLAPDGAAANFGRLLNQPDLGPGSMVIEITESVLIDASDVVRRLFARYRAAGIEIALDDFGTGYSSLAYLKDFEINYLKADRAFVSSLTERSREYAICEAVVAMAHKLGIRVIAEGVESETQRELLARAACDYAQGYLFSRPLPAAEFAATFFSERMREAS